MVTKWGQVRRVGKHVQEHQQETANKHHHVYTAGDIEPSAERYPAGVPPPPRILVASLPFDVVVPLSLRAKLDPVIDEHDPRREQGGRCREDEGRAEQLHGGAVEVHVDRRVEDRGDRGEDVEADDDGGELALRRPVGGAVRLVDVVGDGLGGVDGAEDQKHRRDAEGGEIKADGQAGAFAPCLLGARGGLDGEGHCVRMLDWGRGD